VPQGRQGPKGALDTARSLVAAALAALEASRERIDNLNVYPVPDGDTGTNMALTVRAVRDGLARSNAATAEEAAAEVTRAALMGARGNSGVILSQLVRGAAEAIAAAGRVDAETLARSLRSASDAGYAAVREPQEGTILTVARALAERAEGVANSAPIAEVLPEILAAGDAALARTPEQLPMLAEAGVVDAGGAGLLELVRGIAAHVRGEPLPERAEAVEPLPLEAVHRELSRFRYCTSFFLEGDEVDPARLERELGEFGDSLLVVGSAGAVKVHFHTDDPGRGLSLATAVGVVDEVDVRNMHAQTVEREERLVSVAGEPARSTVVVVSAGAGNARLFESLGATRVVEGGQTMNPPTSEILAAIEATGADEVIVLPNNRNVVLAAEQAAEASSKRVVVVPTEAIQGGLAAMVAFDAARGAEENAEEMRSAALAVRAGAVTRASRTTVLGDVPVEQGDFLGLVDGEAVASGPLVDAVAREVVERLVSADADVLTILLGDESPDVSALRDELGSAYPELEIEVHEGGQPHYPLLFAAE
jgi:DAK2 domain fusion protein YloV